MSKRSGDDSRPSRSTDDEQHPANRWKALVIANSICIELIVWSSIDENSEPVAAASSHHYNNHLALLAAADLTCNTICDKIWQPQKHVLAADA